MKSLNENIEVLNPKNQLNLFGYKRHFNSIAKLFDKKKMPNSVLFSGQKGIGKATHAYHMINYLLSKDFQNKKIYFFMYDQFRDFFWVLHSDGINYKS